MSRRRPTKVVDIPVKVVDDLVDVRCASGRARIREEVWQFNGEVVKYNLAFINHHLFSGDHGRVLGYDNAHGTHERHFKGRVETIEFLHFDDVLERFLDEVRQLRELKA